MSGGKLLAVSDVHSPRYLTNFVASVASMRTKVELAILAGDMVERNNVAALRPVLEVLKRVATKIIAVFGNEEYMGFEGEYRRRYPEVVWLDDECIEVEVGGRKLCIVGSRGALEKPTAWQQKNIPNIQEVYRRRVERIRELVRECRGKGLPTLLVTHYATTFATVVGEKPSIYPYLGCRLIEKLDSESRPTMAIHGHAHNAHVLEARVNGVRVVNVAFPARRSVFVFSVDELSTAEAEVR